VVGALRRGKDGERAGPADFAVASPGERGESAEAHDAVRVSILSCDIILSLRNAVPQLHWQRTGLEKLEWDRVDRWMERLVEHQRVFLIYYHCGTQRSSGRTGYGRGIMLFLLTSRGSAFRISVVKTSVCQLDCGTLHHSAALILKTCRTGCRPLSRHPAGPCCQKNKKEHVELKTWAYQTRPPS
jgi:hypothetical protein